MTVQAIGDVPVTRDGDGLSRGVLRRVAGNATLWLSAAVLLTVALWSVAPGWFTEHDPYTGITVNRLQPPSAEHLFGTDQIGRDLLTRIVYGASASVSSAIIAVAIALFAGSVIGLLSGFIGSWVDPVLTRVVDVLLAIPSFLLAIITVSALGFATVNVAIATGVSAVAVFARVMRSEVLRIKHLSFIESSYLIGGTKHYVLIRHVLPNAYRSVFHLAVLQFGLAIIVISGLAFLGYGDPPPSSEWGLLVADGKEYMKRYPWLVFAPAAVIAVTVLSLYRISRIFGDRT
jgi:peptide/nickel transport system permease protein